jgi:5-hydroxyisourate hydrolase-like protein (transthyretin family)
MQMMLNNGSRKGASMAAKANRTSLKKSAAQAFELDLQKHRAVATMLRLVEERNAPIVECFYQGKARGQYYAWLESNLVFEVAKHLSDQGVPVLTVHDEFIVPTSMEIAVLGCRYFVPFSTAPYTTSGLRDSQSSSR